MTSPILSVVIPTWNRAHLVCQAVESALSQKDGEVEVIVVDDGSTDETASVLARSFGAHIQLLRLPRRCGAGAARNAGVARANGKLLAFLDSDDVWLSGKLTAELEVLKRFPQADAVISDSLCFLEGSPEQGSRFAVNGLLDASQGQARSMGECQWLWTNVLNGVATCSITLRRSAVPRFEGALFAEDLLSCEDWEFELHVYHLCHVVVLPQVWSHVRRFDDGSRVGRAASGAPPTPEQEISLLRDRLKVMGRLHWPNGLDAGLAAELERCRRDTARRLDGFANKSARAFAP